MNYTRIYEYRFRNVDKRKKLVVWKELAKYLFSILGYPDKVLDPAAGKGEFIASVPAKERWAIEINRENIDVEITKGAKVISGDFLTVNLPENYFDAVFVSNFLEHLSSPEEVSFYLEKMKRIMKTGGIIAIMGPNYRYCSREYFDFADHQVILTHQSVEEHLYGAGFKIRNVTPKFLPLSFKGGLPINILLVKIYLAAPILWRFFGKQFLITADK